LRGACRRRRDQIARAGEASGPIAPGPIGKRSELLERDEEKWKPVFRPHPTLNSWNRSRSLFWIDSIQNHRDLGVPAPMYNGTESNAIDKEETWARFFTGAPVRRRRSVERYKIVKRA
jgi:hypothetical protein